MKRELKNIIQHAKALCDDLESCLTDKRLARYDMVGAKAQLEALRAEFKQMGNGTLKGFPHEVSN